MNARAEPLGFPIDRLDMDATVARCEQAIDRREFTQHVAINAAKVVAMQDDPELGELVAGCELVNADGQAIVWASRLLGDPLPERVAGVDLMQRLLALSELRGFRPFILGAKPEVLERAVERLRERHPRLELAGWRDGYFAADEEAAAAEEIRDSGADLLFVAISSPRKEYFLGTYGPGMGVPYVMGVGGAVDIIAGETRRAPRILQRAGLEWLYRLAQEPRRMFRRYAVTNWRFAVLVARAALRRRGRRRTGRLL